MIPLKAIAKLSPWEGKTREAFHEYTEKLAHKSDEPTIKLSASLDEHASRQPIRKSTTS